MTSVSMPTAVARLLNAVNSGDRQDFLESFTEDGVVDDCGQRFQGRAAIAAWSDLELIGDGCRLTVQGVRVLQDEVEVYADLVSTGFNGPTTVTFRLRDGQVASMRVID